MTTATATRTTDAPAADRLTLQVLQENLARGLDAIKSAIPARATLPILANVHVSTDRGRLRLVATDLDLTIIAHIGAKVDVEGAVTVPFATLHKITKASPAATVQLRATSARTLDMECARATVALAGMDADDYPRIPETDLSAPGITIDGADLAAAVKYVEKAAATDDSRPVLTGVLLEASADGVTLTTADDFRLAHRRLTHFEAPPECYGSHIIPLNALQVAAKLATRPSSWRSGRERDEVVIRVHRLHMSLAVGSDLEVVTQLIQATYPNYREFGLAADEPGAIVTFSRDALATMIKRAAVVAKDGSGIIRLEAVAGVAPEPDGLRVGARNDDGADFSGTIDATATWQGSQPEPWRKFAINLQYALDMLAVADETVRAQFASPAQRAMFFSEHGYQCIMPMFVTW